tara:strand:+ start:959 stop:1156 length:198 start_codon:yes stop_codon:yes gene_type:complete
MSPETEECMKEILKLSKKINLKRFNTLQAGMRLIRSETVLLQKLARFAGEDLHQRHPRYFRNLNS